MTPRKLIEALQRLSEAEKDLPLYALHGASGTSHEVGGVRVAAVTANDNAGPLCDMPASTPYVRITID